MSRAAGQKRFDSHPIPKHILTLQYVGVPLSGQVSADVQARYGKLRTEGPNDGLTMLADELVPGGIPILEPGLDHYYRDPDIVLKSLALPRVVIRELERRRGLGAGEEWREPHSGGLPP